MTYMNVPITRDNCGSAKTLLRHAALDPETGCLVWTKRLEPDGYARVMRRGGRKIYAHRIAFFLANGYVPEDGRVIDHVCRNRACINAEHLEDVTSAVNTARGDGPTADKIWMDGVCVNGHVLSEVGLHSAGSRKTCAQCGRDRVKKYRKKVPA